MRPGVDAPSVFSKIPAPGTHADHPAPPVMVPLSEKSEKRIPAAVPGGIRQGGPAVGTVFPERPEREMQRLAISLPGPVDPVHPGRHTGDERQQGKEIEIDRGVQRRRDEQMRDAPDPQGLQRAERFADDQRRPQFLHPRSDLPGCLFRIEIIRAHDNPDAGFRRDPLPQDRRDAAVSPAAHAVDIQYGRSHFYIKSLHALIPLLSVLTPIYLGTEKNRKETVILIIHVSWLEIRYFFLKLRTNLFVVYGILLINIADVPGITENLPKFNSIR